MTETDLATVTMRPDRWGDPARVTQLPGLARAALEHLGVQQPASPVQPTEITVAPSALGDDAVRDLVAVVGADHLDVSDAARLAHTRGYSTPDLLRRRAGDASDAPDAVVSPGSHDEVLGILQVAGDRGFAVVPSGGRTSVTGGLVADRAVYRCAVAVDLGRLDALLAVDEISRTAVLQAGVRGPDAERLLAVTGHTLGHFPQSYEGATIGGYAATRSSGQSSAGYGRFDDMVVALTVATPRGTLSLGTAPKSAAGPDLRQLLLGSEGVFGIITSVTVRIRPRPEQRIFDAWRLASFDDGAAAVRRLAQDGPLPTVVRLSDEAETAVNLADPSGGATPVAGGCLAVCGYEGTPDDVSSRRERASASLRASGAEPLDPAVGEAWRLGRFDAPYLRDAMLDAGALVETLETATFWSNLAPLRTAVTEALTSSLGAAGAPAVVLCHISHVYETGASLYFTVVCAQGADPVGRWFEAKAAAGRAIAATGGTITHHHAVGTDHRDPFAVEVGPLALDVLRSVKRTLDPAGIMNPGVLVG